MTRLYADRDGSALEPHFSRHVDAMTAEGLHGKAAIAAELAYRDAEVDRLRADAARLDWLEVHAPNGDFARFCPATGETVRGVIDAAIDAAMNTTQEEQEP